VIQGKGTAVLLTNFGARREVSGQLHSLAAFPLRKDRVAHWIGVCLGPRNWTIWRTEKFIAHAGIGTSDFPAHGLVTIPTSLPWLPYYEGRYESNTPYFFSETIVTSITKLTHIVGTSCANLRLFSHKICFTINTIFSSLRETLCAGRVEPFAEGSELFTHAVLQLVVVRTTASSGCILWGAVVWRMYSENSRYGLVGVKSWLASSCRLMVSC
jgi:hypothetical protein